ncbi:MAG: hypothetical protein COT73_01455 [Bdellovibrio sp. CG10_big_fil_rev_8_21_14_0_10_47_8]|nr:MAG: hypothetical protein COT73_01455 [Bdellovibrio sp. CG10_big_fil_rev_8_21_14_0_10_47_8]
MNTWSKQIKMAVALFLSLGISMVACQKKSDSAPSVGIKGDVGVDGGVITSSGVLNGYAASLTVTRIDRTAVNQTMAYSQYGYPTQTMLVDVNLNGQVTTLTVQANGPAGQMTLGNMLLYYQGRCVDTTCNNFYLGLILGSNASPQMSQWKEVGIYKIMDQNQIGSAVSFVTFQNQLLSMDQLVYELQDAYSRR